MGADERFVAAVRARLPAADRERRRRRVVAFLSRPAVALFAALSLAIVGASALPVYGATSTRAAVRAVSWLVVAQSAGSNLSAQLIDQLRLGWLPLATAAIVLGGVVMGAWFRLRVRKEGGDVDERSERRVNTALLSLLLLVVIGAAVMPATAIGRGSVHVGNLTIAEDATLDRPQIVLAGDLDLRGVASRPIVVVWGDAYVRQVSSDDVVVIGGSILLDAGSVVERDVLALGGRILRADDAVVVGNIAGQELRWTGSNVDSAPEAAAALLARLRLAFLGAAAGVLLVMAAITVVPWVVVLSAATARGSAVKSAALGAVGLAGGPLIVVPLGLSLVGVPLAGLLAVALTLAWWLGTAAVSLLLGRALLRLAGWDGSVIAAGVVGGAILGGSVGVPVIGAIAIVVGGSIGAGAVLLALVEGEFGSNRQELVAYE